MRTLSINGKGNGYNTRRKYNGKTKIVDYSRIYFKK